MQQVAPDIALARVAADGRLSGHHPGAHERVGASAPVALLRRFTKASACAIAGLVAVVSLPGAVLAGPLEDAQAPYERIGYPEALRKLRPPAAPQDDVGAAAWWRTAAEQGDAEAQHMLGELHYRGVGVPQDDAEAAEWFRTAAEQGHATARYRLALLYHFGIGVPQDYAQALMWFSLIEAPHAARLRDVLSVHMTLDQLTHAARLIRERTLWPSGESAQMPAPRKRGVTSIGGIAEPATPDSRVRAAKGGDRGPTLRGSGFRPRTSG